MNVKKLVMLCALVLSMITQITVNTRPGCTGSACPAGATSGYSGHHGSHRPRPSGSSEGGYHHHWRRRHGFTHAKRKLDASGNPIPGVVLVAEEGKWVEYTRSASAPTVTLTAEELEPEDPLTDVL